MNGLISNLCSKPFVIKGKISTRIDCKLQACLLAIFFLSFNAVSLAQYYPAPSPINQEKLPQTLLKLKNTHNSIDRVKLLLALSNIYFNKPFRLKANLDQAISYAKEAATLSNEIQYTAGYNDAELYLADSYIDKDDPATAENVLKVVNDTSKINLLLAINNYYLTTTSMDERKKIAIANKYAKEAEQLSRLLHEHKKEIDAQIKISTAYLIQANYELADKRIKEEIKDYQAIGYQKLQVPVLLLCIINMSNGNYDKALFYGLEAVRYMKKTNDSTAAGDVYIMLATIYQSIGKFQKGLDYAKLSIDGLSRHSGSSSIYNAILGAVQCMTKLGHINEAETFIKINMNKYPAERLLDEIELRQALGDLYKEQKKYLLAKKYYLENLNIENKDDGSVVATLFELGDIYVQEHQFKLARPYLIKSLKLKDLFETLEMQKVAHYDVFLCDSAAKNYLSAMNQLSTVRRLEEYINAKVKLQEIQKLQIQFETERKENEIKIKDQNIKLLGQRNQIQKASLTRETVVKNVTLGGIMIIFIAATLIYIQFRRKLKLNGIITEKNEMLQHLLVEKEWLLKEVHHRVKNNLHTVISLLESQAAYLKNDALKAIENSQHRIYAMSLIHQKLYQSDDIKTIDMAKYIPELVKYLEDSFDSTDQIQFRLNIDPVSLNISHAIPLGLIINEAVSNSIKYAFPGKTKGEISISMIDKGMRIKLELADNGIGMPLNTNETESNSLGLQLIKGLSEDIEGDISFDVTKGTRITIIFRPDTLNESESVLTSPSMKGVFT